MTPGEITATRTALGLSQSQLAQLLGVHHLTVSKWERGALTPRPHDVAMIQSFHEAQAREPEIGESIGNLIVGAGIAFALYKLLEAAFDDGPTTRRRTARGGRR